MLNSAEPIARAVEIMYGQSFSQLPIYNGSAFAGLLTSDTVARWLGACVNDDVFSLMETLVQEVLQYSETTDGTNVQFISRNTTLFDVLELFQTFEHQGRRLEAILITHNGKPDEKALGIITVWDLHTIYKALS